MKKNLKTAEEKTVKMYNKGITLIALVVTIVVLLILAGITITAVLSEGGIFNTAKNAKITQERAEIMDAATIAYAAAQVEKMTTTTNKTVEELTAEELTKQGYNIKTVNTSDTTIQLSEEYIELEALGESETVNIISQESNSKSFYVLLSNEYYELKMQDKKILLEQEPTDIGELENTVDTELKISSTDTNGNIINILNDKDTIEIFPGENEGEVTVTVEKGNCKDTLIVKVSIPKVAVNFNIRIDPDGMNYESIDRYIDFTKYEIRYQYVVYEGNSETPLIGERIMQSASSLETETIYNFPANRDVKIAVFADLVELGSYEDLYYDTSDFNNIRIKNSSNVNESPFAFTGYQEVYNITSDSSIFIILRPVTSNIRVGISDSQLENISNVKKYKLEFSVAANGFNPSTMISNGTPYQVSIEKEINIEDMYTYTEWNEETGEETVLGSYGMLNPATIFNPIIELQEINGITITFYDEAGNILYNHNINTLIPLQCNYETKILIDSISNPTDVKAVISDY